MHKYRAIDYFDVNSSKVVFHLEWAYIHRNSEPRGSYGLHPTSVPSSSSQFKVKIVQTSPGILKEEQLLKCIFNNIPSHILQKCRINIMYCGYFF